MKTSHQVGFSYFDEPFPENIVFVTHQIIFSGNGIV